MARASASAAAAGQMGLDFGGSTEVHRLFFALWPGDAVRAGIASLAARLQASHQLRGAWLEPEKYHATLHFLGEHSMLRPDLVDAAKRAAGRVRLDRFDWTLDRVDSFAGRRPPCILRSTTEPAALHSLWAQLREALILAGLGANLGARFTPHVTLAYAQRELAEPLPVEPLLWPVDTLALIHSGSAFPEYRLLARWPLDQR